MYFKTLSLFLAVFLLLTVPVHSGSSQSVTGSERILQELFRQHRSNVLIEISGNVHKILPDDNKGSRHQRFLVRFRTAQTVLVAHNIDIAPRVPDLQVGKAIALKGEYEWNAKGGVIHWTHRSTGSHTSGWIRYNNRIYQ